MDQSEINSVDYIGSFPSEAKCPKSDKPEFAFIGRSNVGKSSLINMLTGRKELARVSKQPGKTQSLNYYLVDDTWFLVDLPGYGYAKTSKNNRNKWEKMIEQYLRKRSTLAVAFVLIDARHSLQKIDLEFINWLGESQIPFTIVFTKLDKLKKQERKANIHAIEQSLLAYWNELPQRFLTSAVKREGKEELLTFIAELNDRN